MRNFRSLTATVVTYMATIAMVSVVDANADDFRQWQSYGGDSGNSHYSALDQINTSNVKQLTVAWTYHSAEGETIDPISELQINPIVIDRVLYGRNPNHNIFAIKADSGQVLWRYNPFADEAGLMGSYMRGLSYWQSKDGKAKRLFSSASHYLLALDAANGRPIDSFGEHGRVDLRRGLGRDPESISIYSPSPGVIYKNMIIMGSAVTEMAGAAPGHIRAYDVRSGKILWTFHTIPQPGEYGADSWPSGAWKQAGGANAWAGLSVDQQRGVVYIPTGSPTPDFNGQQRHGKNLFGNTILALDANSGKRLWHFQTVHHDLWDRDLSSAPTLVTAVHKGKKIDALAQASKQGVLYLLNRDTGEPLFPISEVPVPSSEVPGEKSWPTQPRVTLPEPFVRQSFSEQDLSDITPQTHQYLKEIFDREVAHKQFAFMRPPGLKGTIVFPGFYGGANWGGGAFDPDTQLYYINATEAPHLVNMEAVQVQEGDEFGFGAFIYRKNCGGCHGPDREGFYPYAPALTGLPERSNKSAAMQTILRGKGRMMPFANLPNHERQAVVDYLFSADLPIKTANKSASKKVRTEYVFGGYNDFVDENWYPAVKPPWGTLNAIDLNSGKRRWQITLGEYPQLTEQGIAPTGTRNYGGPVVSKGGLIFIAATSDEKFRAFDKISGELLWEAKLPAGGYATPSIYEIDGKQFIVIACGGGKLGTKAGDQYVAFSLPDEASSSAPEKNAPNKASADKESKGGN